MRTLIAAAALMILALPHAQARGPDVIVTAPMYTPPFSKTCPGLIRQTICPGTSRQMCCNKCARAVRKAFSGGSVRMQCERWGERVACPRKC